MFYPLPTPRVEVTMSKYQPLQDHLGAMPHSRVRMSFGELEKILGFRLPNSAYIHSAWWANQTDTARRAHARAWTNAGFRVDGFSQNPGNEWVDFQR